MLLTFLAYVQDSDSISPGVGISVCGNYMDPQMGFSNGDNYLAPNVGSPNEGILHPPNVDTLGVGDLTNPFWGILYKKYVENLNFYPILIFYANVNSSNIFDLCHDFTSISWSASTSVPMHFRGNGNLFSKYSITSCFQYFIKRVLHISVPLISCTIWQLNCTLSYLSYAEVFSNFWQ